jgi:hypothetical protein
VLNIDEAEGNIRDLFSSAHRIAKREEEDGRTRSSRKLLTTRTKSGMLLLPIAK